MSDRNNDYGQYPGRYPAVVQEYDAERRMCRVEIPGITAGSEAPPWAEIEYPIGDKSIAGGGGTEIEILPNDAVWVAFIGGDPRYPLITGWRNAREGNEAGWRRWHHPNIAMSGDENVTVDAGTVSCVRGGTEVWIEAPIIRLKGAVIFDAGLAESGSGQALKIASDVSITLESPSITDDTPRHVTTGKHTDSVGKHYDGALE